MQRRKFLLGAGSAAVGTSALVGSGAYSAMSAERGAYINVVADDEGLVGLTPGIESDTVKLGDDSGELVIDTSPGDDQTGINNNSTYLFGEFENITDPLETVRPQDWFGGVAFVVWFGTHWSGGILEGNDLAISPITGSSEPTVDTNASVSNEEPQGELAVDEEEHAFRVTNNDTADHDILLTVPNGVHLGGAYGLDSLGFEDVGPGDFIAVTFAVVAGEDTADSQLSGQLGVSTDTGTTEGSEQIPQ